jgi:hypothetical protein
MAKLNEVKFDNLPFENAIKFVKGNGSRKLAVFSDPECPFCKKFEQELTKVDNITVYIFPYPIAGCIRRRQPQPRPSGARPTVMPPGRMRC